MKNGNHIRLADVRAIKVETLAQAHGWESEHVVKITHCAPFGVPEVEICVFDSDLAACRYADEIGRAAREEILSEANRSIEGDRRRQHDRFMDRVCVVASGILASDTGDNIPISSALDMARAAIETLTSELAAS